MGAFLTADWRNVLAATYAVDAARLEPHLPPECEIDHLDGAARLSLVAFEFRRTRVRGLAIPGHTAFPEVNLRFYIRHRGERGVVFVRELVPRRAIAGLARLLYNEPYARVPMRVVTRGEGRGLRVTHRFGAGHASAVSAVADVPAAALPAEGSAQHWLTHHHLAAGRTRRGRLQTYEVQHPLWALAPVLELDVAVDFERVYGAEWAWLGDETPSHRTFALGSAIAVSPARRA